MWTNEEDTKFNGLSVKWCDEASGSGHIMPMVAIFSGFSETEMPSDGFIVLEVQGMSMNANLDDRSSEVGYIVMLKQDENMDNFFEWYDEVIVYPYFRDLLKLYYRTPLDAEDVPEDLSARVWAKDTVCDGKEF